MADIDAFAQNIIGVSNLIDSEDNKVLVNGTDEEGVQGMEVNVLDLPMSDEELLDLKEVWEIKSNLYIAKIKPRQEKNKLYYAGRQTGGNVSSNLIFEAEETFIPQALSKNPEPVVFSDNSQEGKDASNDIKTMLQYHADVLNLRSKLGTMVRHWSVYFLGVVKHGYDEKSKDITTEIRKPQNFILDPDGYIDDYGDYVGSYLGERIECTAQDLIDLFPKQKTYIAVRVDGKLGTNVVRTEWWTNEYCFTTFQDVVLDKHKNPYFNYETTESSTDEYGLIEHTVTPGQNHFARPKMPYTFLSVFSLQEQPHDITNLIEQSIPNQDRINDRDVQISKNLRVSNNSLVLSMLHGWTSENAKQGANAIEDGDPILAPASAGEDSIRRLPASPLPSGILEAQESDKNTLRSVFGTQGLSAQQQTADTTARGMILNQSHDSTRIGGGIGDKLEQVADNVFNWWLQLYFVFYDEAHYGAIMGNDKAVGYVTLLNSNINRNFVVSVAPNSMQPKDEITEMNMAMERWSAQSIDPIGLMKAINDPDPMESAKRLVMWNTNPQLYMMTYFPENQPMQDSANPANPIQTGGVPPPPDQSLGSPPASPSLSQVPLSAGVAQPQ